MKGFWVVEDDCEEEEPDPILGLRFCDVALAPR